MQEPAGSLDEAGDDQPPLPNEVIIEPAASAPSRASAVRLGVACMTKKPVAFATWLTHHFGLGVERLFLRVEDTPELAELLEPWRDKVDVQHASKEAGRRDWEGQTQRQATHVRVAILRGRRLGLTHLLHLDDDELLYCPGGADVLFAHLSRMPRSCCEAHVLTLEALAPSDNVVDPFLEARAFRHSRRRYASYGAHKGCAGKSIGCLALRDLDPRSPHHFACDKAVDPHEGNFDKTSLVPPGTAVILHYESVHFGRWRDKFTDYSRFVMAGGEQSFLFDFYCQSFGACKRLLVAEKSGYREGLQAAEANLKKTWADWKLEPPGLPHIAVGAAPDVRRDLGITLIRPVAAAEEQQPDAQAGIAADLRELGAQLSRAGLPPDYAGRLAATDSGCVAALLSGSLCEQEVKALAKRASLPLGHRVRLSQALAAGQSLS